MTTPNPPTATADLSALTPGELCEAYRETVKALRGKSFAKAIPITHERGAFFIWGLWYRRAEMERLIAALRERAKRPEEPAP